jgi:hypothetical protein
MRATCIEVAERLLETELVVPEEAIA